MGMLIPCLLAAILNGCAMQLFREPIKIGDGPLLALYMFIFSAFLLLWSVRIYPGNLRKIGRMQCLLEFFIAEFIMEAMIVDFWFPLEKNIHDALPVLAQNIEDWLSSGDFSADATMDFLKGETLPFLISYALAVFFLLAILQASRVVDFTLIREEGFGCFLKHLKRKFKLGLRRIGRQLGLNKQTNINNVFLIQNKSISTYLTSLSQKLTMNALKKGLIHLKPPLTRPKTTQSPAEYCLDSIRKYDYENFLCTILLKNTSRSVALAVRGLNVEIARVAEQTSQDNIGLMRLKFWEETINKCYSKDLKLIPKHPVALELYRAISNANLTKRYLNNLVVARQNYINKTSFQTLEEMEKYLEQTMSNVYYLILEGCNIKNVHADHAASHLGKAQGIIQQLRSIPHSRQLNFIPIPQEVLIKHHLSQQDVLRGTKSEKLSNCVFEVASRAHQHLVKSRSLMEKVPKEARRVLLPAIPVSIYLDRLLRVDHDILDQHLQRRSWNLLVSLYFTQLVSQALHKGLRGRNSGDVICRPVANSRTNERMPY
ncbi:unnamed protein product [Ceutorhynchus assimilis]|uniref:NADH dehydrogenase (Ubiquinone) complex I, assembly factor 6 n=1 Tax=Ceutorhynchus assimilis TaxID=467358 RepID=A0A9N9QMP8_9CUCU|nr:unnamed protein product [Ceutorhynchus assimilis]